MALEEDQYSFLRVLVEYLDRDNITVSERDLPSSRTDSEIRLHASIMLDVLLHDALGQAIDQSLVSAKRMYRPRLEALRARVAALPYLSSDPSQLAFTAKAVASELEKIANEALGIRGSEAVAVALQRAYQSARLLMLASPSLRLAHGIFNAFEGCAHALDKGGIKGTTGKEAVAAVVQRGLDTCAAVSRKESAAESPVLVTFSRDLGIMVPLANTGASHSVEESRMRLLVSYGLCRLRPMLWRRMYDSGAYAGVFTGPPSRANTGAKIEPQTVLLQEADRLELVESIADKFKNDGEMQEKVALALKSLRQAYQAFAGEVALWNVPKDAVPRVVARQVALATKYAMEAGVDADDLMDAARETLALGMVLK